MHVSLKHTYMSLGNWSFAFEDFFREDITRDVGNQYISNIFLTLASARYR